MAKQSLIFAVTFVALFALMYGFLALVGATPDPLPADSTVATEPAQQSVPVVYAAGVQNAELPTRVVAKKIGLDVTIANPDTTDVATLDEHLLNGAVRYPTSAQLGVEGTVLLFGHSSYLPIVNNKNFKAFNGLQKLKAGDMVSVYSAGYEYRYAVVGVRLANAQEDVVELPATGQHLALVTCDSFGTKSDRYVLTADLEGVYAR